MTTVRIPHIPPQCTYFFIFFRSEFREQTDKRFAEKGVEEADHVDLLAAVKSLFVENESIWPPHYSVYFLGHLPKFKHWIPSIKARQ
jgi:hypothetical protein